MTTGVNNQENEDDSKAPVTRPHTFLYENSKSADGVKEIIISEDQGPGLRKSGSDSVATVVEYAESDGGYGWVVLCGASLSAFTAFSTMQSWGTCILQILHRPLLAQNKSLTNITHWYFVSYTIGVMQDYLVAHMFYDSKHAQVLVSFVGTLCYFVSELVTPLAQVILHRIGVRLSLLLGAFLISGGLIGSGFASTIWHLYVSQGVCYGAGISIIYLAITTVIPQWFSKRRSTATGVVLSGIGLAGLIIPYVMFASNNALSASWTFRILGLVYLVANLVACVLVKEKKAHNPEPSTSCGNESEGKSGSKIEGQLSLATVLELLTNANFLIYILAAIFQVLSRNVPFFFLPSYATAIGLDVAQGTSLISIACAASFVGRVVVGILADRWGNLIVGAIFGIITGLSSLLIWMFAYNYPMLVVQAVVIGFSFDTYYILLPPTLLVLLGKQKFTTGLSVLMVLTSPAILGPSLISAIDDALDCEQFLPHKIFSGVLPILSSLVLLILRSRINRTDI